jgi:hypothetical protein
VSQAGTIVATTNGGNTWTVQTSGTTNALIGTDSLSGVSSITYSAMGANPIAATTVPGASATFTLSTPGNSTVTYRATDKAGNVEVDKTVTLSVVAAVVGGKNFTLGQGPVSMTWTGGNVQAGYYIVRIGMASGTGSIIPPSLLPAAATTYVDTDVLTESWYCYQLVPFDSVGTAQGSSDLLCTFPNTRAGAAPPANFRLALNQSSMASMTWTGPLVLPDAYVLFAIPLDGTPERATAPPPTATTATDATAGILTCYQLYALLGAAVSGNTDMLCAYPAQSKFAASGLSAAQVLERTTGAAATLRAPSRAPAP